MEIKGMRWYVEEKKVVNLSYQLCWSEIYDTAQHTWTLFVFVFFPLCLLEWQNTVAVCWAVECYGMELCLMWSLSFWNNVIWERIIFPTQASLFLCRCLSLRGSRKVSLPKLVKLLHIFRLNRVISFLDRQKHTHVRFLCKPVISESCYVLDDDVVTTVALRMISTSTHSIDGSQKAC